MDITIPAARLRRTLTAVVLLLTALSFAGSLGTLVLHRNFGGALRIFDVNSELSIPNWYSSAALAVAAALLGAVAATLRARQETRGLLAWASLGVIFALLSLDEVASIHNAKSDQLARALHVGGWLHFAWVIPALALVTVVGASFIPFLRSLAPRRRRQFVVAGLVYVGGAVGMEMVGAKFFDDAGGRPTFAYVVCTHIEEFMEMFGIVLFNAALVEHLAELLPDGLRLRFADD